MYAEIESRIDVPQSATLPHRTLPIADTSPRRAGGKCSSCAMQRICMPQGFPQTVLDAVFHVVEHFSYHTGQIVYLAKQLSGGANFQIETDWFAMVTGDEAPEFSAL